MNAAPDAIFCHICKRAVELEFEDYEEEEKEDLQHCNVCHKPLCWDCGTACDTETCERRVCPGACHNLAMHNGLFAHCHLCNNGMCSDCYSPLLRYRAPYSTDETFGLWCMQCVHHAGAVEGTHDAQKWTMYACNRAV